MDAGSVRIQTARLVLRPCRDADKPAFRIILNSTAMMAELGGVRSAQEIDALIDKRIADQARHGHSYWAVELRDTRELIGSCGIRIADNYPAAPIEGLFEIGWRIGERHWGHGYAREAAEASLGWAWANTTAPFIASWTTPANMRSVALMKRLGMKPRPELNFRWPPSRRNDPNALLVVYVIERPAQVGS